MPHKILNVVVCHNHLECHNSKIADCLTLQAPWRGPSLQAHNFKTEQTETRLVPGQCSWLVGCSMLSSNLLGFVVHQLKLLILMRLCVLQSLDFPLVVPTATYNA